MTEVLMELMKKFQAVTRGYSIGDEIKNMDIAFY